MIMLLLTFMLSVYLPRRVMCLVVGYYLSVCLSVRPAADHNFTRISILYCRFGSQPKLCESNLLANLAHGQSHGHQNMVDSKIAVLIL